MFPTGSATPHADGPVAAAFYPGHVRHLPDNRGAVRGDCGGRAALLSKRRPLRAPLIVVDLDPESNKGIWQPTVRSVRRDLERLIQDCSVPERMACRRLPVCQCRGHVAFTRMHLREYAPSDRQFRTRARPLEFRARGLEKS